MNLIKLDGKSVLELVSVTYTTGSKGLLCLCVDYKYTNGDYILTFEGEEAPEKDYMRVDKTLSIRQFKRKYPKFRVFMQGFVNVGK